LRRGKRHHRRGRRRGLRRRDRGRARGKGRRAADRAVPTRATAMPGWVRVQSAPRDDHHDHAPSGRAGHGDAAL